MVSQASAEKPLPPQLGKDRLDAVVEAVKVALSDPVLRSMPQRAVQAKIWHEHPVVANVLHELRAHEEAVRANILQVTSQLVYALHEHAVDATLERAGIAGQSNADSRKDDDLSIGATCLDAKERLYMVLKEYDWLQDFFRRYPLHFYENSFAFVHLIAPKPLPVVVQVIGLGVAGSMAVSGLAKRGMIVTGYDKRAETGPSGVTSRYQNASWRAYDTAAHMLDATAFEMLAASRQRISVPQQDGTTAVVSSDRVQIILGAAMQAALDSARRYQAKLVFGCSPDDYLASESDIVALFCGAHTLPAFPALDQNIPVYAWPELDSPCAMWLCARPSVHTEPTTFRRGEVGAEQWHYTIESARDDLLDLERVQWNQTAQHKYQLRKHGGTALPDEQEAQYANQVSKLQNVMDTVQSSKGRFDYIFTNAPKNAHNQAKRDDVADAVVLDGNYTVEVKMATKSSVFQGELLQQLRTKHVILGGDACVPPNPMAAYGATLACEAAYQLVLLATAVGHVNAMVEHFQGLQQQDETLSLNVDSWLENVQDLKVLLLQHYEARAVAENYFQWVQTLICNAYSLPAFY